MFRLNQIILSADGRRISYDYEASREISKYFNKREKLFTAYDVSVGMVPESIAVIPLLANLMPIAWFAGFDVHVDEVDADFVTSLENIRLELLKHYPEIPAPGLRLHYKRLTLNKISKTAVAMLFSGGVDAFATYFRHADENPELITIQGADIELTDSQQWQNVKSFNENEPVLAQNKKHYIQTNFQKFYTHNVDLLLPNLGWWGNIQHGLALICCVAPLSYLRGLGTIYIASTRSSHMEFNPWGSMPEIDERISWGGISVIHDGFELRRQDKVDAIVSAAGRLPAKPALRVCYSDFKDSLNCSKCEKCIRTIFGIMLAGDDPNEYGFIADASIYDMIQSAVSHGFRSRGTQFFWQEIIAKASASQNIFTFSDAAEESAKRSQTLEIIAQNCTQDLVKATGSRKLKHIFIKKYPRIFSRYLKLRRSFL